MRHREDSRARKVPIYNIGSVPVLSSSGNDGWVSYSLAFWSGGDDLDPVDTYRALDERHVEGVRRIDAEEVERALLEGLPGWTRDSNILQPPGADPNGAPAFDVSIGTYLAQFTGYGIEDGEHFNAIIDVMHPLGFRLFDPQTNERFG